MTHIFLALDPETRRVSVQSHPWSDGDFPPGLRGAGWPRRQLDIPTEDLERILAGGVPDDEIDALHRSWWDAAGSGPRWPRLPDGS
jgi:hypothetical protein